MRRVGRGRYVCVVCGDPLNEETVKNQDPFCKTDCARIFHGVPLLPLKRGVVGVSA